MTYTKIAPDGTTSFVKDGETHVFLIYGKPRERWVKCPHCGKRADIPKGPYRDQSFHHMDCGKNFVVNKKASFA